VFDIFENEKVEPVGLLEGMCGQSKGTGSTNIRKPGNINNPESNNVKQLKENDSTVSEKIIKIVDFNKEKKLQKEKVNKKIKIKFF
jgi:hypothetical protein